MCRASWVPPRRSPPSIETSAGTNSLVTSPCARGELVDDVEAVRDPVRACRR